MDAWSIVLALAGPLEVLWIVFVALYIILQRRSASATFAWFFALAFVPVFGILVYLVIGPRRFERRKKRRRRARGAVLQAGSRADAPVEELDAEPDPLGLRDLVESAVGRAGRPRMGGLRLLLDGDEKYDALRRAIEAAQAHVHLEYYIWEPDEVGAALRDALVARAQEGVEVRVLVDGFGSSKAASRFWAPLKDAGGQVRRFNELSLARWRPRMANFRTHRKIAVVDGVVGFTGGMNVSKVHSRAHVGDAAWRDTHVEVRGPVVRGLQLVFFEDWHYAGGDAPRVDEYLADVPATAEQPHVMQVVSSGPDEGLDAIHKVFFVGIAAAERRVQLTSPYFVPDETVVNALSAAALRGTEVTVLVPAAGDQPLVAAAARSYYPELLESGVRIFEYGEPMLHAKSLVVDDLALVGTANADNRSFRLNFEVAVAVYSASVAEQLADAFAADLRNAREVTLKQVRRWSLRRRLASSTARLFSPVL